MDSAAHSIRIGRNSGRGSVPACPNCSRPKTIAKVFDLSWRSANRTSPASERRVSPFVGWSAISHMRGSNRPRSLAGRFSSYPSAWPDRLEIRRSAEAKMKISDEIVGPAKGAWHLFLERTESLRPNLHKYCRSLSGSVWDGEDLVQDTLLRAFARLSQASEPIENLRAYMFKVASNLWIDRFRGSREVAYADFPEQVQPELAQPYEIRDA